MTKENGLFNILAVVTPDGVI